MSLNVIFYIDRKISKSSMVSIENKFVDFKFKFLSIFWENRKQYKMFIDKNSNYSISCYSKTADRITKKQFSGLLA